MGTPNDLPPVTTIENLPNEVMVYIFSLAFVDTKTAVRTALMSKQWKELWYSFPYFRYNMFSTDLTGIENELSFVHDYFTHRTGLVLESFEITIHPTTPQPLLFECLRYADANQATHVRVYTLDKEESVYPTRPLCFNNPGFPFLHLRSLVLACCPISISQLPESWRLPELRYLRLHGFKLNDKTQLVECPKLEELVLNDCCIGTRWKVKHVIIDLPKLKILKIKHWLHTHRRHRLLVIAPNLMDIHYIGPPAAVVLQQHVDHLKTLHIDLRYQRRACIRNHNNGQVRITDHPKRAGEEGLEMVREISSAVNQIKCLSLSMDTVKALLVVPCVFQNEVHNIEKIRIYRRHPLTQLSINEIQLMMRRMAPQAYLIFDTSIAGSDDEGAAGKHE